MKTILTVLATVVVLAVAALGFVYSGLYDVSAARPDQGLIAWALAATQERSVHRRAEAIEVPPLSDPQTVRTGLVHYHEMCVTCHAAPGISASEIGQGLHPYPPELAGEAAEESPAEMFWIIKHGIKMTGMPAFGPTHSDEELWAIVAFLKQLPKMSPEEYQAAVRAAGLGPAGTGPAEEAEAGSPGQAAPGEGHHHGPGTPPH
jgi:mono/diheme cytochrome c family protein